MVEQRQMAGERRSLGVDSDDKAETVAGQELRDTIGIVLGEVFIPTSIN